MVSKLGGGVVSSRLITAEEGAVLVEELEATAPFIDQRYGDDVALAVRAALTDAELFVSYNMPAKALGPLLSALPKAPQDLRLNQRLAALHTRAGRFAEAAVGCRTLETIYHDAGHPEEASRYGELAAKYEERAAASPAPAATETLPPLPDLTEPDFSIAVETEVESPGAGVQEDVPAAPAAEKPAMFFHAAAATSATKAAERAEFEVEAAPAGEEGEIDLSEEWDGAPAGEPAVETPAVQAAAAPRHGEIKHDNSHEVAETVEEIRFYLTHSMVEQARDGMAKLERLTTDLATLSTMRQEIARAEQAPVAAEPEVVEEIAIEEPAPAPAMELAPEP